MSISVHSWLDLAVTAVQVSALEALRDDEVLSVRPLTHRVKSCAVDFLEAANCANRREQLSLWIYLRVFG